MVSLIGALGSLLFALCAIPQAYSDWKLGRSELSYAMIYMWLGGSACMFVYIGNTISWYDPLIITYTINFVSLAVSLRYKMMPRNILTKS